MKIWAARAVWSLISRLEHDALIKSDRVEARYAAHAARRRFFERGQASKTRVDRAGPGRFSSRSTKLAKRLRSVTGLGGVLVGRVRAGLCCSQSNHIKTPYALARAQAPRSPKAATRRPQRAAKAKSGCVRLRKESAFKVRSVHSRQLSTERASPRRAARNRLQATADAVTISCRAAPRRTHSKQARRRFPADSRRAQNDGGRVLPPRAPLAQPDLLPKAAAAPPARALEPRGPSVLQGGARVERPQELLCFGRDLRDPVRT